MTVVRITCRQFAPVLGSVERNVDTCVDLVRAAVADGADLVVLPELATSGYMFESPREALDASLTPDAPAWGRLAAAAGDATVVIGFCEGAGGSAHNSAAVVDGAGLRTIYRKTHLWDRELSVFTPGDSPPPVVTTRWGTLGVLICYDLEFPEMPRLLGLARCDVVAVPVNWPLLARPAGEHPAEVIAAMAAARSSGLYVACCDRTGRERGQEWTEGTAIVGPDGWVITTADEDGTATAAADLALARDKSLSTVNDVLEDRRPELYQTTATQPRSSTCST